MTGLPAILLAVALALPAAATSDTDRELIAHALKSAQAAIGQTAEHLRLAETELASVKQQAADQAADATRNQQVAREWEAKSHQETKRADAAELSRGHWRARALWTWAGIAGVLGIAGFFLVSKGYLAVALKALKPV